MCLQACGVPVCRCTRMGVHALYVRLWRLEVNLRFHGDRGSLTCSGSYWFSQAGSGSKSPGSSWLIFPALGLQDVPDFSLCTLRVELRSPSLPGSNSTYSCRDCSQWPALCSLPADKRPVSDVRCEGRVTVGSCLSHMSVLLLGAQSFGEGCPSCRDEWTSDRNRGVRKRNLFVGRWLIHF